MPPSLDAAVWIFAALAGALGGPALLVLGLAALTRGRAVAPAAADSGRVRNPDVVLLLLGALTGVFEIIAGILGAIGGLLLRGAAYVALVVLPVALLCGLAAYGLHAHAGWARGLAGVLSGGALAVALVVFLSAKTTVRLFTVLPLLGSAYVLAAVVRGWGA